MLRLTGEVSGVNRSRNVSETTSQAMNGADSVSSRSAILCMAAGRTRRPAARCTWIRYFARPATVKLCNREPRGHVKLNIQRFRRIGWFGMFSGCSLDSA
jgi:hypothetical protein